MPRKLFFVALLLTGSLPAVLAQPILGVGQYVENARVIEVVQAEPASAGLPSPADKQLVRVREVLKGLDTAQTLLLPKASLAPGQRSLILFPYDPPGSWTPTLQTTVDDAPVPRVWQMDAAGKADTHGVPTQAGSTFYPQSSPTGTDLAQVRECIAARTPEQVGLNAQMLDAALFPEKLAALSRTDANRAAFVRLVVTLHDLNRDVSALARLLESQDPAVRAAALKKLEARTGAQVAPPRDTDSAALHEWMLAWSGQKAPADTRERWPEVPASLQAPRTASRTPCCKRCAKTTRVPSPKTLPAGWTPACNGTARSRPPPTASTLPCWRAAT